MFDQISSVFYDEANELLDNLEDQLLTLETDPENQEVISAVFRAMHTIKGSSAMFGLEDISHFTHKMENAFDMVRSGKIPVSASLIQITLQARDHIRNMLSTEITPEIQNTSDFLESQLNEYIEACGIQTTQSVTAQKAIIPASSKSENNGQNTWRISFTPASSIMMNGTRPELLVKELSEMGTATVVSFTENIPCLSDITAEQCYISWDIILTTNKSENDINDVFIFIDEDSKIKIEKITEPNIHKRLGEILVDRKLVSEEELTRLIEEQKKVGELLVNKNIITDQQVRSALAEQEHIKKIATPPAEQQASSSSPNSQTIRVNSLKLDRLIDLVGELVTFNARLGSIASQIKNSQLQGLSEFGEQIIFSLRDNAMDMRMLPIGTIFSRFRRLVHDLSGQLGKNMELITEGADTELDKTVIEKLNDPLVHLIRNSADHGIESPEVRDLMGKPSAGTITLSAKHAGAFVLITISDDGSGLNKKAIREKAIERGLMKETDNLTDAQIYDMIFQSGFSTNKTVTAISGRGVGMDVVKRDIDSLGGSVSIETTAGEGTSFILKIPLTLAIIEGMMVELGQNRYVIPLSSIEECIEYEPMDDDNFLCSHITVRGEYLPCINMRKYFEISGVPPEEQQVIIVNDQSAKIGIIVDKIIGNHQTVIKPLGKLFKKIEGLSGSTILGDGTVALILDIFKLSEVIRKMDKSSK